MIIVCMVYIHCVSGSTKYIVRGLPHPPHLALRYSCIRTVRRTYTHLGSMRQRSLIERFFLYFKYRVVYRRARSKPVYLLVAAKTKHTQTTHTHTRHVQKGLVSSHVLYTSDAVGSISYTHICAGNSSQHRARPCRDMRGNDQYAKTHFGAVGTVCPHIHSRASRHSRMYI